MVENCFISRPY